MLAKAGIELKVKQQEVRHPTCPLILPLRHELLHHDQDEIQKFSDQKETNFVRDSELVSGRGSC